MKKLKIFLQGKKNQRVKTLYNIVDKKHKVKIGWVFPYEKIIYDNKLSSQKFLKTGVNRSKSILLFYIKNIV